MIETQLKASPGATGARVTGLVFDIKRYALHDGPGIRTTVFLKGCALRCWWCHNPESQLPRPERQEKELRLDTACLTEVVTLGKNMTAADVMTEVLPDKVFYEESGGGVTFSGGEPLLQSDFLTDLLLESGRKGIHRVLDTCGYAPRASLSQVVSHVELFLYDLKIMNDHDHRQYTGVSNNLVLSNLEYLLEEHAHIIIRFPLIPGLTDTDRNLESLRTYLDERPALSRIDILPYHQIAKSKYERLGRSYPARAVAPPSNEAVKRVQKFFENGHRIVRVGG